MKMKRNVLQYYNQNVKNNPVTVTIIDHLFLMKAYMYILFTLQEDVYSAWKKGHCK